jgi:hypothetical protein
VREESAGSAKVTQLGKSTQDPVEGP